MTGSGEHKNTSCPRAQGNLATPLALPKDTKSEHAGLFSTLTLFNAERQSGML